MAMNDDMQMRADSLSLVAGYVGLQLNKAAMDWSCLMDAIATINSGDEPQEGDAVCRFFERFICDEDELEEVLNRYLTGSRDIAYTWNRYLIICLGNTRGRMKSCANVIMDTDDLIAKRF